MQRKDSSQEHCERVVGIDVGKAMLDVCILPDSRQFRVRNDKNGHQQLVENLGRLGSCHLVLEATGRYHAKLQQALNAAGLTVSVINPYRSRKFADTCGQLAKTDKIDAKLLARFGLIMRPPSSLVRTKNEIEINALVHGRDTLITDRTALKNRLEACQIEHLRQLYKKRIDVLDQDIRALEGHIIDVIRSDPILWRRLEILTSIPGIGPICATALIASMPELGQATAKEVAALLGVAPMNWDSGTKRGKRAIRGGRHLARKAMYMPALSVATRGDSSFARQYRSLVARGKPAKVAITAIMRQLIVVANALIKNDRLWQPESA